MQPTDCVAAELTLNWYHGFTDRYFLNAGERQSVIVIGKCVNCREPHLFTLNNEPVQPVSVQDLTRQRNLLNYIKDANNDAD